MPKPLIADIVIVGAGIAGLSAALSALESGARNIVVLEARYVPGGNSMFAEGFFALDTALTDSQSINDVKNKLWRKSLDYSHQRVDPFLIRGFIDESAHSLRWLEDRGFKFIWRNVFHDDETRLYASEIKAKSRTGAAIIRSLVKECAEKGIRVFTGTRARKLLLDRKGRVKGVVAEVEGQEYKISGCCVILASGGFGGNKALLKCYVPFYTEAIGLVGIPTQGDGLLMAAEAGADTQDTIVLETEGPAFRWSRQLSMAVTAHHNTIWINKKGRRFTEELFNPFECANILCRQPEQVSYTLMDETIKNSIINEELDNLGGLIDKQDTVMEAKLDRMIQYHAAKGRIKIAGSWDEIAQWAGVPAASLKTTIQEYNAYCQQGRDGSFNKDPAYLLPLRHPPYYAIQCNPTILVTHGGLKIDLKMEVLDKQAEAIPGLFAAGIDTGGVDADTYNYYLPGHSFGFSLSSGRLAGRSAAQYAANECVDQVKDQDIR